MMRSAPCIGSYEPLSEGPQYSDAMTRLLNITALLVFALLSACASASRSTPSATWTSRDLFIGDSTVGGLPVNGPQRPLYPPEERARSGEAGFLVAFVLDSAGRAEMPTVSFISSIAPGFVRSVCIYYQSARFEPARSAGVPVRALTVQPWVFALGGGQWYGKRLDATPIRETFRREGADAAMSEIEHLQHC